MLNRKYKKIIYTGLFLLPFLAFFVFSKSFQPIKFAVIGFLSGPIKIISSPIKEFKKLLYYHRTFDEYIRLREENQSLIGRMIGFQEVIRENSRLEELLDFKRKLVYSSVAASVIGRNPSFWDSSMTIDKGEEDGVKVGMPVVNSLGVVGKIGEVGQSQSKVILITDPEFSVAALVQRARESGLVTGTLQGLCRLQYLDKSADVQVGDKVITSKLSSFFPDSLIIGEIIKVQDNPRSPSPDCIIKPAVSFSQIEEVLVIFTQEK